jgi:DNA-binding GntR family transcriptional regulator
LTLAKLLHRIPFEPPQLETILKGAKTVATKLNVRVNRKRPESMTRQIREQLDELIDQGALVAGTFLPSERELANTLKVARNVVRGAYEQLMEAGKLRSEGRRGRSVSRGGTTTKRKSTKSTKKSRKK